MSSLLPSGFVILTCVLSPVAKEREAFLVKRGENQFTLRSLRQNLARLRIYYFNIEVVLVDMHAGLLLALKSDARTGDLCQAINIIGLDSKALLYALSHLLSPGLCAEYARLQLVVLRAIALLRESLTYISGI